MRLKPGERGRERPGQSPAVYDAGAAAAKGQRQRGSGGGHLEQAISTEVGTQVVHHEQEDVAHPPCCCRRRRGWQSGWSHWRARGPRPGAAAWRRHRGPCVRRPCPRHPLRHGRRRRWPRWLRWLHRSSTPGWRPRRTRSSTPGFRWSTLVDYALVAARSIAGGTSCVLGRVGLLSLARCLWLHPALRRRGRSVRRPALRVSGRRRHALLGAVWLLGPGCTALRHHASHVLKLHTRNREAG